MRLALTLLTFVLLISTKETYSQTAPATLRPDTPIERSINRSESHTYAITLGEEEYLQFAVVQRGIDLIVRVTSPGGKSLGDFDTPNGGDGPENVAIVSVDAGIYQITVAPLDPKGDRDGGTYEIKTLEIRKATEQELKIAKSEEARRAKGLELLNSLVNAIPEIRLPQTRIRVKFKAAVLLWSIDEKKASELLNEAVNDIKEYVTNLNIEDETYDQVYFGIQQLRFEAVQLLALSDPEAALNLSRSSRLSSADPNTSRSEQEQEDHFELSLATQIAARNPKRAYELAQETLKKGFSTSLVGTLERLSRQEPELASNLSKSITSKLLEQNFAKTQQAAELAMSLIRESTQSISPRPANSESHSRSPLLAPAEAKMLVQKTLNEALAVKPNREDMRMGFWSVAVLTELRNLGEQIDSFVPGASTSIRNKLAEMGRDQTGQTWLRFQDTMQEFKVTETTKDALENVPPEMRGALVQQLIQRQVNQADYAEAKQTVLDNYSDPRGRRQALVNLEREAALNEFRQGRVDEALKHIAKIEPRSTRAQLIAEVASRLGSGQKRAQALNYLESARSLLGTSIQAEDQAQMSALLNLAGAFSRYDSKRAFEILDPLVDQFNEISMAAKTLSGFGPQFFFDGELPLPNGSFVSEIATQLGQNLGILSFTDFERAKLTADRLALPEVRFAINLEIVQQAIMPSGVYSPSAAYLNNRNR